MLVLTRKAGQNIHIGENIVISVFRIKGQRARLGITAPRGVTIRREELLIKDLSGITDLNVTQKAATAVC